MRAYVAGSSAERSIVHGWIGKLRAKGIVITHDWTGGEEWEAGGDHRLTEEARRRHMNADLCGIIEADTIWLLVPPYPSPGCWAEFGYALAVRDSSISAQMTVLHVVNDRKSIIASGDWKKSIFTEAADAQFETHQAAFDAIITLRNVMGYGMAS
jgi:hypothetical protein